MEAMRKRFLSFYDDQRKDPIPILNECLRKAIQNNELIDTFDLKGNYPSMRKRKIDNDDVEVIYKMLHLNVFITSLDLSYNSITDRGARTLAELIKVLKEK